MPSKYRKIPVLACRKAISLQEKGNKGTNCVCVCVCLWNVLSLCYNLNKKYFLILKKNWEAS